MITIVVILFAGIVIFMLAGISDKLSSKDGRHEAKMMYKALQILKKGQNKQNPEPPWAPSKEPIQTKTHSRNQKIVFWSGLIIVLVAFLIFVLANTN